MNFQQEFFNDFGERFKELQLKNVFVKDDEVLVTFLYPSTVKELSDDEKKEISNWFQNKLALERLRIRVKFLRVFVEEKLVLKSILGFFEKRFKLVSTYISANSFSIDIGPLDVQVRVELSSRMNAFFVENKVANELAKFLKDNFLVDFSVQLKENPELVDEVDIENVEMKTSNKLIPRFDVEIVKEIVGKNIPTRPEFLSSITKPKTNVVVAGFVKKVEKKEYIAKFGKKAGETKSFYVLQIQDKTGKMECVYFCPKKNEKVMESVEEFMFLLFHGDAKLNKLGKLQLVVDKIALANMVEKEKTQVEASTLEHVVETEKLESLEQNTMFEQKSKFNARIMNNTIVVFDIETTGLDFTTSQIIELGAVKLVKGNIVEKFSTFVKPRERIPFKVTELTGITNEMVEDAPSVECVIKDFYEFSKGCVLCGHNIIGFDMIFIRREGKNIGLDFENELIDTLVEARMAHLNTTRYKLGTVLKLFGLTNEGAHRAWNDAMATAKLLLKLNEA